MSSLRTDPSSEAPESHISIAKVLRDAIPGGVILDQYSNPNNPLAHYYGTWEEIMYAINTSSLPRKGVDVLVAGAGTGGTITGLARGARDSEKETHIHTTVVACDPVGSILGGGEVGSYEVEGIGYDFFPEVLDVPLVDEWIKTNDDESFAAAKRIVRHEGLFVGGSSGTALAGALRYLKSEEGAKVAKDPEANVVIICPDSVRNYMSKPWFLSKDGDDSLRDEIRGIIGRDLDDAYGAAKTETQDADTQDARDKASANGHTSSTTQA